MSLQPTRHLLRKFSQASKSAAAKLGSGANLRYISEIPAPHLGFIALLTPKQNV
jgi:hypothetical protein